MDEANQTAALARLELTDLWGLAGRVATRPRDIGVTTSLELVTPSQMDPERYQRGNRADGVRELRGGAHLGRRTVAKCGGGRGQADAIAATVASLAKKICVSMPAVCIDGLSPMPITF